MEDTKEVLPKPILIEDLGMMFATEGSKHKRRYGLYRCGFCGNNFKASISSVKYGNTKSCGCYKKQVIKNGANKKHNLCNTRIHKIWRNLKNRILNPKYKKYEYYGGRGITICDEWKSDFMSFYNWAMSNDYSDELSIDRIDNEGNYEPSNCRWVTQTMQNRNQRIQTNNTSGYKGCSFVKRLKKYRAYIRVDGKRIHLGLYLTPEDGAVAYNNYIIENDLEGFPLNKLPDSHIHLQLPTKPHHQTLG